VYARPPAPDSERVRKECEAATDRVRDELQAARTKARALLQQRESQIAALQLRLRTGGGAAGNLMASPGGGGGNIESLSAVAVGASPEPGTGAGAGAVTAAAVNARTRGRGLLAGSHAGSGSGHGGALVHDDLAALPAPSSSSSSARIVAAPVASASGGSGGAFNPAALLEAAIADSSPSATPSPHQQRHSSANFDAGDGASADGSSNDDLFGGGRLALQLGNLHHERGDTASASSSVPSSLGGSPRAATTKTAHAAMPTQHQQQQQQLRGLALVRSGTPLSDNGTPRHGATDDGESDSEEHRHTADGGRESSASSSAAAAAQGEAAFAHLAALQAQRDDELHRHRQHIRRLQQLLREQEAVTAQASGALEEGRARVKELERASKRSGANLEYLKNMIVKWMEEDQQEQLFTVIATILQFSPDEMQRVNAKRKKGVFGLW
jgi:hypothetical protein